MFCALSEGALPARGVSSAIALGVAHAHAYNDPYAHAYANFDAYASALTYADDGEVGGGYGHIWAAALRLSEK